MAARLRLLVPGLLGPLPAQARRWEGLRAPLPTLERLLGRADRQVRQLDRLGLIGLGFEITPAAELPAGALGLLGEGGEPGDDYWFRADPVHLRPDRDRLLLFAEVAPSPEEAQRLIAECNRLLAEDGITLALGPGGGWYLRAAAPAELITTPTFVADRRYIDPYLPQGADARRWLSLLTELQMLLHASAVNIERESRGEAVINGLWIWGGGRLPQKVQTESEKVYTDESLLKGLARAAGVEAAPAVAADPAHATGLVWLDEADRAIGAADLDAWRRALEVLERDWLAPQVQRLRHGALDELIIETERLRLTVSGAGLRRFWRRPRSLARDLEFHDTQADSA